MKTLTLIVSVALVALGAEMAAASGGGNGNGDRATGAGGVADHAGSWHGLGSGHQDGQGGTAQDRHNFDGATAGGSGQSPTDNPKNAGQNDN